MIYISNTQSSEITLVLYDSCSNLVNPYFAFKIINSNTKQETIFCQDDHSPAPYYYNSFTISIANQSGLTAGIINVDSGQYEFVVYEMANQYDLNTDNALNIVKKGILNIVGSQSDYTDYTGNSDVTPTYNNI